MENALLIMNSAHFRGKAWDYILNEFEHENKRRTCSQCGSHFSCLDSACHYPTLWSPVTSKHVCALKTTTENLSLEHIIREFGQLKQTSQNFHNVSMNGKVSESKSAWNKMGKQVWWRLMWPDKTVKWTQGIHLSNNEHYKSPFQSSNHSLKKMYQYNVSRIVYVDLLAKVNVLFCCQQNRRINCTLKYLIYKFLKL